MYSVSSSYAMRTSVRSLAVRPSSGSRCVKPLSATAPDQKSSLSSPSRRTDPPSSARRRYAPTRSSCATVRPGMENRQRSTNAPTAGWTRLHTIEGICGSETPRSMGKVGEQVYPRRGCPQRGGNRRVVGLTGPRDQPTADAYPQMSKKSTLSVEAGGPAVTK